MEQEKTPRERLEDLVSLLVADWRPTARQVLWAIRIGIVLVPTVAIGYVYGVTLWDWIKLLVVPAAIAGAGLWFNRQQRERELKMAREQREQESQIAERRTQDEVLQTYLDQMSAMLIPNKDQPSLYRARPGDSLSSVARARTLTVLPRLDWQRKARVVQFLFESGLIAKERPIVALGGANLRGANLLGANLGGADLRDADLLQADLSFADLRGADLSGANLIGGSLSTADLRGATMIKAKLGYADLSLANLRDADLRHASLVGANLEKADLGDANLVHAVVGFANLGMASLRAADLREVYLDQTYLRGADLSGADLSGVLFTAERPPLAEYVESLTRPNGQSYENWLKEAEGK